MAVRYCPTDYLSQLGGRLGLRGLRIGRHITGVVEGRDGGVQGFMTDEGGFVLAVFVWEAGVRGDGVLGQGVFGGVGVVRLGGMRMGWMGFMGCEVFQGLVLEVYRGGVVGWDVLGAVHL